MALNNRVERLAGIAGGKKKLAEICAVSPSLVSKWVKKNAVDPAFNVRIKSALAGSLYSPEADLDGTYAAKWAAAVACLDEVEVCACCGQPLEGRRAI